MTKLKLVSLQEGGSATMSKILFAGIEIENRLHGVPTLFVVDYTIDLLTYAQNYGHIYFQPGYLQKHGYSQVFQLLTNPAKWIISIEVTAQMVKDIPVQILDAVHIVMIINCPEIVHLKHFDTIRLDVIPSHNFSCPLSQFNETIPKQYQGDYTVLEE